MMSHRFYEWLAMLAADNANLLNMALFGLFIVLTWEAIRLWPPSLQTWLRAGVLIIGGVCYVAFTALALYVLVAASL